LINLDKNYIIGNNIILQIQKLQMSCFLLIKINLKETKKTSGLKWPITWHQYKSKYQSMTVSCKNVDVITLEDGGKAVYLCILIMFN